MRGRKNLYICKTLLLIYVGLVGIIIYRRKQFTSVTCLHQ